jgi:hypothetical protein
MSQDSRRGYAELMRKTKDFSAQRLKSRVDSGDTRCPTCRQYGRSTRTMIILMRSRSAQPRLGPPGFVNLYPRQGAKDYATLTSDHVFGQAWVGTTTAEILNANDVLIGTADRCRTGPDWSTMRQLRYTVIADRREAVSKGQRGVVHKIRSWDKRSKL